MVKNVFKKLGKKQKNNKGFSLVELIIVIAIMAILAGALAPALIKYINKSRASTDISNADTIRSACQTAMSNEEAMASLGSTAKTATVTSWKASGSFGQELSEILGSASLKGKYYDKNSEFKVLIDVANNKVEVYSGGNTNKLLSPQN